MGRPVCVSAPSNIAIIKYMGKVDADRNLPANGSLSLTLNRLATWVELRPVAAGGGGWKRELPDVELTMCDGSPEGGMQYRVPELDEKGVGRVLSHLARVKEAAQGLLSLHGIASGDPGPVEFRTANTFPAQAGIASSASSFAALTLAQLAICSSDRARFKVLYESDPSFRGEIAALSRQGSGSSCRSFDGPWVAWRGEEARRVVASSSLPPLCDLVVIVSADRKAVSSSAAHHRVLTSPLWEGRVQRTEARLAQVEAAIAEGDLRTLARLSWQEAWEMHSLFHTSDPPFTYWTPETLAVLQWVRPMIEAKLPPIVTLDAGPNVHILVSEASVQEWTRKIRSAFPALPILIDSQGSGARLISL